MFSLTLQEYWVQGCLQCLLSALVQSSLIYPSVSQFPGGTLSHLLSVWFGSSLGKEHAKHTFHCEFVQCETLLSIQVLKTRLNLP